MELKEELIKVFRGIKALLSKNPSSCHDGQCYATWPSHVSLVCDSSLHCQLIEFTALVGFEEEQIKIIFFTSWDDISNGNSKAAFLQRASRWQHFKVSPSQSVNFNEHPDLKQWDLISQPVHNKAAFICGGRGERNEAKLFIVDNKSAQQKQFFFKVVQSLSFGLWSIVPLWMKIYQIWQALHSLPVLWCRKINGNKKVGLHFPPVTLQIWHKIHLYSSAKQTYYSICFQGFI